MKTTITTVAIFLALASAIQAADVSVKLSDVHLCCQSSVKGVQAAVGKVPGATVKADKDEGSVSIGGPDKTTVQKAVDALVAGGYFGKSSDAAVKLNAHSGAIGRKVQSLKVEGVHLCCGKCVTAVNDAL